MSEPSTMPNTPLSADNYQHPDWFLQNLIEMVNGSSIGIEIPLSLNVNGLIVSGTLISGKKYFQMFARNFADNVSGDAEDKEAVYANFAAHGDTYNTEDYNSKSTGQPVYMHLENAKFVTSPKETIPLGDGMLWRGRVIDVSGFTFGRLSYSSR